MVSFRSFWSFRWFRWFRFGRFVSLFRVLVHAKISSVRSALLIAEIQRDRLSCDIISTSSTFDLAASISTPNNNSKHHCFCEELTWLCLHFCTPIWRRSNGCQDFCHVNENDHCISYTASNFFSRYGCHRQLIPLL